MEKKIHILDENSSETDFDYVAQRLFATPGSMITTQTVVEDGVSKTIFDSELDNITVIGVEALGNLSNRYMNMKIEQDKYIAEKAEEDSKFIGEPVDIDNF